MSGHIFNQILYLFTNKSVIGSRSYDVTSGVPLVFVDVMDRKPTCSLQQFRWLLDVTFSDCFQGQFQNCENCKLCQAINQSFYNCSVIESFFSLLATLCTQPVILTFYLLYKVALYDLLYLCINTITKMSEIKAKCRISLISSSLLI